MSTRRVYMSPVGSDAGDGSAASPVATWSRAIALLAGAGEIVMRGGDYRDLTTLVGAYDISIMAETGQRVRIVGGTEVTGIAKTPGFTSVYQAPWTTAPTLPWFWQHDVPDELTRIADVERHPLHRGRTHRLPATRIWRAASVAEIETAARPSWYWEAGTLYFSVAGGGDATTSRIFYPSRNWGIRNANPEPVHLELRGLEFWYGTVDLSRTTYLLQDLLVVGGYGTSVVRSLARGEELRCEAGGASNDGFGAHGTPLPGYAYGPVASTVVAVDEYSHDNWADGDSPHERCEGSFVGGLLEYNGARGIAVAAGAHVSMIGTHARKNGQPDAAASGGEGFAAVIATTAAEGGVGTQLTCIDCLSEGDRYGFGAHAPDAIVEVTRGLTVGASVGAYSTATMPTARMLLRDCADVGSAVVLLGPGLFTILTSTPVQ